MRFQRVGVIMGGLSAEREVSLASGRAVAAGLRTAGYEVAEIDATRRLDAQIRKAEIEAAFVALHGRWGEDGTVQGMLEVMGVPYTGSSVLASALAMDKIASRQLLTAAGLRMPRAWIVASPDPAALPAEVTPPVVVKPPGEGSSVDVSIVRRSEDLGEALERAVARSGRALVERYVRGVEVAVAFLDGEVLGSVEIETHREFYDYSAKYDAGGSTHYIPPRLPPDRVEEAEDLGRLACATLDCSGAARADLIVPGSEPAVLLEVNTVPGMTETSLLPEIARAAGISFEDLVLRMMEGARLHVD